jgi:hypothetical protein
MRRSLTLLGLLLVGAVAWACGDKLMLIMGVKGALIRPGHTAVILAYPGNTASADMIRSLQVQPVMRKVGHKVRVVEDADGLDSALKAGKYDLVVADMASAGEISQHLSSAPSRPVLLPVAFKASKEEQSAAQKKYHCLLKAPSGVESYLSAIDQAMDWKLKGATH